MKKLLWKVVIKFSNKLDFVSGNSNIPFYFYLNDGRYIKRDLLNLTEKKKKSYFVPFRFISSQHFVVIKSLHFSCRQ